MWELKKFYYRAYQKVLYVFTLFMNWDAPETISGAGSVKKLPEFIKGKGVSNVLVVTDKGLMGLHLLDGLFEELEKVGIKYTVYDGVQPNPTFDNIEEARKLYLDNGCEGFIAFGGGSPMDCAKAAAARIVRPNKSLEKMRGTLKVMKKLPPFFAVPTTAGTQLLPHQGRAHRVCHGGRPYRMVAAR